ncbi:MAG: SpoVG family protein [Defluviitaleaceae bacterium]|nr:SpoVG family protein [Defluviitaleaceae bacterium]
MSNTKLDVRVYPIDEPKGGTRAFASVSVEDLVAIRGIRVMEGSNGLFINMPQSKDPKTNEYHDIAFPVAKGLRQEISKAILDEYKVQMREASADKFADRKPSLEEGLRNGAAKAAANAPAPRTGAMPKNADVAV